MKVWCNSCEKYDEGERDRLFSRHQNHCVLKLRDDTPLEEIRNGTIINMWLE